MKKDLAQNLLISGCEPRIKKQNISTINGSKLVLLLTLFSLLSGCKKDNENNKEEPADVVYGWYRFVAKMQLLVNPQPVVLQLYRNFGYIGVGLYESVRPGIKGAQSLSSSLYQMPTMPTAEANVDYLWSATANAYLAASFKQFITGLTDANKASIDSMENANNSRFKLSVSEPVLSRSQSFGRAIATSIYNWSTTDNFNLGSVGYTPPVFPGSYVSTPPNFPAALGPFLKDSRPFLAYSLTAIAPTPPNAYSEDPSSSFYKEAKEVYDIGKTLTDDQKAIANWWADAGGAGVGVPAPQHLLNIITKVLEGQGAKIGQAAELYAKTAIVFRDGPIITFRSKYTYNLLRPVTYIQKLIDPTWLPYLVTPPYPEYPSGIMSYYGPVSQLLIKEFGDIAFSDDTYSWRGLPARQYASLSKMAEEVALSRVYAGIHYRATQSASIELGKQLANRIAEINF
jgi:hypothetical protein